MRKLALACAVALSLSLMTSPTSGQAAGGPIVLMGIDAEDGGVGGHGPITVYEGVVTSIRSNVTNGGTGILVIGGGKAPTDNVTAFWDRIGTDLGVPVTYVNGAAGIAAQSFAGFAMLAVVSSVGQTPSGGLTEAENTALTARQSEVAAFVNGGGGLFGLTQTGLTTPYGYLTVVGTFQVQGGLSYNDITPTPEGQAIGITDALDVTAWHEVYLVYPAFLGVLATNNVQNGGFGQPAAIGGARVFVGVQPTPTPSPTPSPSPSPSPTSTPTPIPAPTTVPPPPAEPPPAEPLPVQPTFTG